MSMEEVFGKPIASYTIDQAIEDGFYNQLDQQAASEAGFKWPVYGTQGVFKLILLPENYQGCQDVAGRMWDVLFLAAMCIRRLPPDRNSFSFKVAVRTVKELKTKSIDGGIRHHSINCCIQHSEKQNGPIITLYLPSED